MILIRNLMLSQVDRLVVYASQYRGPMKSGPRVPFQLDCSALLRVMKSPRIKSRMASVPKFL